MKRLFLLALANLLFLLSSCSLQPLDGGFAHYLWGTWVTTNHSSHGLAGEGTMRIGFDTIRLAGFQPRVFPPVDQTVPFQGIAPNADLRGFSESGMFVIDNIGRNEYVRYRFSDNHRDILVLEFNSGDLFFQKTYELW